MAGVWGTVRGALFGKSFVRINKRPKVIIAGDAIVGKTTLLSEWGNNPASRPNRWITNRKSGAGLEIICQEEGNATTYIEEIAELSDFTLSGAHACVLLFSLIDRQTLLTVKRKSIPLILSSRGKNCPIILVGTKLDLREAIKIPKNTTKGTTTKGNSSNKELPSPPNIPPWDEKVDGGLPSIQDLPSEVLMKIFDFLEVENLISCSSVCKGWHEISKYPYIWSNRPERVVLTSEGNEVKKQFPEVVMYIEIGLGQIRNPKTSKQLIRRVIEEAATSGEKLVTPKVEEYDES